MSNSTSEISENGLLDEWTILALIYLKENWIAIFTALIVTVLVVTMFNKIVSPYFHETYKRLLFYDSALDHLKDVLEMDYDVLWNQPEFCLAFLKFHEAYQTFVSVARSDYSGKISKVSRYNKYTIIELH
ncbi:hypothetical protein RB195_000246 [Necator americanus]|uniref:Uncharacterized protein n=1 Tax=Necator americanus TaxID=51031 RepID=A0ABR1D8Q0_NECAM